MPSSSVKYVGLDVHKEAIVVAVRDGAGKLVMESIVETKASTLLDSCMGCGENCMSQPCISALDEEGVRIVALWQHDAASSDTLSVRTMGK